MAVDLLIGFTRDEHNLFRKVRPGRTPRNYERLRARVAAGVQRVDERAASSESPTPAAAPNYDDHNLFMVRAADVPPPPPGTDAEDDATFNDRVADLVRVAAHRVASRLMIAPPDFASVVRR